MESTNVEKIKIVQKSCRTQDEVLLKIGLLSGQSETNLQRVLLFLVTLCYDS